MTPTTTRFKNIPGPTPEQQAAFALREREDKLKMARAILSAAALGEAIAHYTDGDLRSSTTHYIPVNRETVGRAARILFG